MKLIVFIFLKFIVPINCQDLLTFVEDLSKTNLIGTIRHIIILDDIDIENLVGFWSSKHLSITSLTHLNLTEKVNYFQNKQNLMQSVVININAEYSTEDLKIIAKHNLFEKAKWIFKEQNYDDLNVLRLDSHFYIWSRKNDFIHLSEIYAVQKKQLFHNELARWSLSKMVINSGMEYIWMRRADLNNVTLLNAHLYWGNMINRKQYQNGNYE